MTRFSRYFVHVCMLTLLCSQGIQKSSADQPKDLNKAGLAKIAFSVGKHAVTWQDVKDRYVFILKTSNMEDTQKVRDVFFPQVVKQLCTEYIQLAITEKAGLKYTKADNEDALKFFAQMNNTDLAVLKNDFKVRGISLRTLEQRLKAQNLWVQYVRGAESSVVKITPAKLEKKRQEHEKARQKTQYELKEIVLPDADMANQIYNRAKQGNTPFSILAQEFSTAISAKNGGKIGWVTAEQMGVNARDALVDVISAQATSYKAVGYISRPLKTARGYIIYNVSDVKLPNKPAYGQTELTIIKREVTIPVFTSDEGVKAFEEQINKFINVKGEKEFKAYECAYAEGEPSTQKAVLTALPEQMRHLLEGVSVGIATKPVQLDSNKMAIFMVVRRDIKPEQPLTDQDLIAEIRQTMLERFATSHLRQYRTLIPISDATGVLENATPIIKTTVATKES